MDQANPFGLHTVTPYLVVEDVEQVLAFVKNILGATPRGEPRRRDNGSIMHAEVLIGDSVVMMGEPMDNSGPSPGMLYVYVPDCDHAHAKALAAGATEVMPPADYPHGDRYGGVRDGGGNVWWLVTHQGTKDPD